MTQMSPRRLALVSIAVVTVAAVVGVSILAVAAGGSALAYKVNDTRVSQQTVDDLLADLADTEDEQIKQQVVVTDGGVNSSVSAQVITLNIVNDLLREVAATRGVKVTDADREAAKQAAGSTLERYPASYVDLVVDTQAYATALGLADTDAINTFVAQQFRKADVYVNPRYGTWNPRFGVCPPTGCSATGTG